MRKLVLGLFGAAALAVGSSANAVENITPINSLFLNLGGSAQFGADVLGQASINDSFLFTLFGDYDANAQVSSISLSGNDIDFSSIFVDVNDLAHSFYQTGFDPATETWQLDPTFLAAGTHTVFVNGNLGTSGNGSYVGNINITTPVPEPATWAMMIIGFGAVGAGMRRSRKRPALAQLA
jgi:hypothetical protein